MGLILHPQEDYPPGPNIVAFEAYMFVTKPKFMQRHRDSDFLICVCVDGAFNYAVFPGMDVRKEVMDAVNKDLVTRGCSPFNKGNELGCCMIYMESDQPLQGSKDVVDFIDSLREFSRVMRRFVVFVSHFSQDMNDGFGGSTGEPEMPHVHVLYERKPGEENVLQEWLYQHSDGDTNA